MFLHPALGLKSSVRRVAKHFNLNVMESHSIQIAFQVVPHVTYFFGVACEMVLTLPPGELPLEFQGYKIGYLGRQDWVSSVGGLPCFREEAVYASLQLVSRLFHAALSQVQAGLPLPI